jgi:hypothetical protein
MTDKRKEALEAIERSYTSAVAQQSGRMCIDIQHMPDLRTALTQPQPVMGEDEAVKGRPATRGLSTCRGYQMVEGNAGESQAANRPQILRHYQDRWGEVMKKAKRGKLNRFSQGFIVAMNNVASGHGIGTEVLELYRDIGEPTPEEVRKAGMGDHDVQIVERIRKVYLDE